jgi:hypothetical protein
VPANLLRVSFLGSIPASPEGPERLESRCFQSLLRGGLPAPFRIPFGWQEHMLNSLSAQGFVCAASQNPDRTL